MVPVYTVVFFPKRIKVKQSPYCAGSSQPTILDLEAPVRHATTNLFATPKEKLVRINAVSDGAPDERHPVENNGRFLWVAEKQLVEDVEDDCEDEEGEERGGGDGKG